MKKILTSFTGGMPLLQNDLKFLQESYTEITIQLMRALSDTVYVPIILYGCVYNGTSISGGAIYYNSAFYNILGSNGSGTLYFHDVISYQSDGIKLFKNGINRSVYEVKSGTITTSPTGGSTFNIPYTTCVRVEDLLGTKLKNTNNLATDTIMGFVQIATAAEVSLATDTQKSITPKTLYDYITIRNSLLYSSDSDVQNATGTGLMPTAKLDLHTEINGTDLSLNTSLVKSNGVTGGSNLHLIYLNNGMKLLQGFVQTAAGLTTNSGILVNNVIANPSGYVAATLCNSTISGIKFYEVYFKPTDNKIYIKRVVPGEAIESDVTIYITLYFK